MSSLNPLNDLSKIYLDTVAKAHKEEEASEVKRWKGYLNKEEALQEKQKDTYDQVAAVIDYDRSKKGTDDATYDSMHGKKKQAKKERDYAAFERKKMKRDAQRSGHPWEHAKGSTSEKEGKKSEKTKHVRDPQYNSYEPDGNVIQDSHTQKYGQLMDAYQSIYREEKAETPAAEEEKMKKDDKLFGSPNKKKKKKGHDCASKVKHEQFGIGNCIKGMHDLDENGVVQHYDVFFEHGIEKNVPVTSLQILEGHMHEHVIHEKMAAKDYDGDGKIESGKDEYFGSKDKAIKKAMGKKSPEAIEAKRRKDDDLAGSPLKKEDVEVTEAMSSYDKARKAAARRAADRNAARRRGEMGGRMERETYTSEGGTEMHHKGYRATPMKKEGFSDWRNDLIEVSDTVGSGGVPLTDVQAAKKVKESKVNNKVVINPKLGEAIEQIGGELIEVQEDMTPKKKKKEDQLEVAMEKGKKALTSLTKQGTDWAEEKDWIQKAVKRPGAFTRKAKAAGQSVQQFAKTVDDNPGKYSTRTKKQANLAQTFASMKKEDVEELFYTLIAE
jgi:hypothetical protein